MRALVVGDRAGDGVVEVGGLDELLGGVDLRLLHERVVVEQRPQQGLEERHLLRLGEVLGAEQVVEAVEHLLEGDHLGIPLLTGAGGGHAGQSDPHRRG